ncbi:T9SS type B sorting domain-containing protein [Carboxylicivirga linearis]|uniref:T9SS type B sorting domain-containing protein n=1 Tax=Carboxylicivirga linearis TaxID=1628157 RepID=A0ABS5JWL9_9BACT|nr:T9SS type B sorting domain-containing protein [Carboxylicivirga linearis]MBS2099310.1 T9SS type B sorting domain-containing protein [Carboxylicivirga linearis]
MRKDLLTRLLSLFLLCISFSVNAQVGREFWFVAPDVTDRHGDEPLLMRVTTFDNPATVTITMPANTGFSTISFNVPANSQYSQLLNKNDIENAPANSVNNKGIHIQSTEDVTIYYEVANDGNPDKFTLKCDNALGLDFMVPSQNVYGNYSSYGGDANEKADIVATEDNTVVTITPAIDVTGHQAGVPYDITLNRGQTYSIECRDIAPSAALAGTRIKSTKRIAVTISDDSINERSHPHDLIGDQLIPISVIGDTYMAVNTSKAPNSKNNQNTVQKVFIMAIEDNTHVYINNTTDASITLMAGETVDIDITEHALFIKASKRVYAYQVTGLVNVTSGKQNANELGSAVLPSLTCTGSRVVAITRIFNRDFWVNLVAKRSIINDFVLKDNNGNVINDLKPPKFQWTPVNVQGLDNGQDVWMTCAANLDDLTTGTTYTIENTKGIFHLSVLDENDPTAPNSPGSVSYGYFSSYNSFYVEGPSQACYGNQIQLQAKEGMVSYDWFSSIDGPLDAFQNQSSIMVSESGKYWVEVSDNLGCPQVDTLDVDFIAPDIDLGNDTTVCPGETVDLSVTTGYASYNWSTGDTGTSIQVIPVDGSTTTVSIEVTDDMGCMANDTVGLSTFDVPEIILDTQNVCEGSAVTITSDFERYEWTFNGTVINADPTQNYIIPQNSGDYTITAWTADGCSVTQTVTITILDLPSFTLEDAFICENNSYTFNGPTGDYTYLWTDELNNTSQNISFVTAAEGVYTLEVTDTNGCTAQQSATLQFVAPLPLNLLVDNAQCQGATISIENANNYSSYNWKFNNGITEEDLVNQNPDDQYTISNAGDSESGIYKVIATDLNGCSVKDSVSLSFTEPQQPTLSLNQDLCEGGTATILASGGLQNYRWFFQGTELNNFAGQQSITVSQPGEYVVEGTSASCIVSTSINVIQYGLPEVVLSDDVSFCPGGEASVSIVNFVKSSDGTNLDYLYWNNETDRKLTDWQVAEYTTGTAGTYSVTVVDQHGCTATDDVVVTENTPTPFDLGAPVAGCENVGVVLSNPISDSQSQEWYQVVNANDIFIGNQNDYTAIQSGTYKLTILDANGCESVDSVDVVINQTPSFSLTNVEACPGETFTVNGPNGYSSYSWSDGTTEVSAIQNFTTVVAGSYTLEVTDNNGCSATESVVLSNYSPIAVDLGPDREECAGIDLILSASDSHSNYTWYFNGAPLATPMPQEHILSIINGDVADNGIYKVIAEDTNGCEVVDSVDVEFRNVPNIAVVQTEDLCDGAEVELRASDRYDTYEWRFENNPLPQYDDELSIRINQEGRYTVIASILGCVKTNQIDVEKNGLPSISLAGDNSFCAGDSAAIIVTAFNPASNEGQFAYLYWNGNSNDRINDWQSAEFITNLAGTYSVTAVDELGCEVTESVDVDENSPSNVNLSDRSACSNDGALLQNPVNNAQSQSWYQTISGNDILVATSADYLAMQSGTYKLQVVDENGCESEDDLNVVINQTPEFSLNDAEECFGVAHTFNGPAGYSYTWNTGATSQDFETTNSGTYTLTITDANNCSASASATLIYLMPLAIDLGPDVEECAETNITLAVTSSHTGFNWYFNDGSGSEVNLGNPFDDYIINNAQTGNSGVYRVEANDSNGCSVEDKVSVEVYDIVDPQLELSNYLCQDGTAKIIASAGYDSYEWFYNGRSMTLPIDQNVVDISEAGFYALQTSYKKCVRQNDIGVDVYGLPEVQLPDVFSLCDGASKTLSVENYTPASSANEFSYLYWNNDDTKRFTDWTLVGYEVRDEGRYYVTAVDTLGCMASDSVDVNFFNSAELELTGPFEACNSIGVLLENPLSSALSYTWNRIEYGNEITVASDENYLATQSGTYRLNLTDENGCETTDETVVTIRPNPTLDLGTDKEICEGDYLAAITSGDYASYMWNDDPSLNTDQLYVNASGLYKLEVANEFGCIAVDSVLISVVSMPQISLTDKLSCSFAIDTLIATDQAIYSYLWSTGETTNQIIVDKEGTYSVTVSSGNGCDATAEASVVWRSSPKVTLGDDEYTCPIDGMPMLTAEGGPFDSYLWQDGTRGSSTVANQVDTVNWVLVTDEFGCTGYDTKTVKLYPEPELELLNDSAVCQFDSLGIALDTDLYVIGWSTGQTDYDIWLKEAGQYWVSVSDGCHIVNDTMQLVVNPTPIVARLDTSIYAQVVMYAEGGTEPYLYAMNDGIPGESNVFSNLDNGDYILCVEDANGCLAADTISINDNLDLEVPKFFTPNDDGYNDTWEIGGLDRLPDSEIIIYDRFGKLLIRYKASDPGWNGKYLGKPVRSDDYWYVIELIPTGKNLKGNLTLKR